MRKKTKRYDNGEKNYGLPSDMSRAANKFLGDDSGRSISLRTAHGLKKSLDLNISDDAAVNLTHAGMLATGLLMASKNSALRTGGLCLLGGFVALYQNGK